MKMGRILTIIIHINNDPKEDDILGAEEWGKICIQNEFENMGCI